ncbi:MAG: DUF481 domain-containing protein [Sphingobacteriales bacterium]|nr:MAG: DUF481 domain-containing protein [Sphingobacteriales bacterium]
MRRKTTTGRRFSLVVALTVPIIFWSLHGRAQYTDSTTKFIGFASTGVINNTQDSKSYVLNNNLRFGIRRKDVSLNANGAWIYGKQNNNLTNNDFTSSVDFNIITRNPRFYYWGLATYEKSRSLKINDRAQVGLGVAYSVLEEKEVFLNFSEGVLFEKSDLITSDTTRELNTILRNSFRIRYRWTISKIVTLDGTHFIQNSFADASDYILKSTNSLSVRLYRGLSFTSALTFNKVNRTKRENLLITFGLNLEKYF